MNSSHLPGMMSGMIRVLVALAVLVLTACGSGAEDHPDWAGPSELRPRAGALDVESFRQHAEAVDESWERDPATLAREFLQSAQGELAVDGNTVTLLRDGLEDDSIRAERWVVEVEADGERWRLVSARWEQRCHVGRGQQTFSPELCL